MGLGKKAEELDNRTRFDAYQMPEQHTEVNSTIQQELCNTAVIIMLFLHTKSSPRNVALCIFDSLLHCWTISSASKVGPGSTVLHFFAGASNLETSSVLTLWCHWHKWGGCSSVTLLLVCMQAGTKASAISFKQKLLSQICHTNKHTDWWEFSGMCSAKFTKHLRQQMFPK